MLVAGPVATRVRPIHTLVPGRVRLAVRGLYRSEPLKARLETGLSRIPEVRSVQASPLTGRVLILCHPDTPLAHLSAAIEDLLGAEPEAAAPRPPLPPAVALDRALTAVACAPLAALMRELAAGWRALGSRAASAPSDPPRGSVQEVQPWHLMGLSEVLARLETSAEQGLSPQEAAARLRRYGENRLRSVERRSDLAIFLGQFNSLPVALLGASAAVALMTGGPLDAAVIGAVVLINGVIGFVTERQAERTIRALGATGVPAANVLRGGAAATIPVEAIVPGDVLLLTPGTYIAADIRLVRDHRLTVDESALTGESLPVVKDAGFVADTDTPLGDRKLMAYMGTHVTGGNGRGLVVATAAATELGQIQTLVGEAQSPETPMQRQLGRLGTQLALLSGGVCAGVFGIGVLRGLAWLEMLKSAVSLAVAAVPEGLPAVATTTLAMGIAEMRRHKVAVRHLDAVETLGSVQVFCMDKTGTLTLNRMSVVALYAGQQDLRVHDGQFLGEAGALDPLERDELVHLLQVVSLCSETEIRPDGRLEGTATENALVQLALDAGIDVAGLRVRYPNLRTRYRSEGLPYMRTLHRDRDGKALLAVKGSPDEVLRLCGHQLRDGRRVQLSRQARTAIERANQRMAGDALRVLGVAYREVDGDQIPERTERLTWLGLAGMADPLRPGMDRLVAEYRRAGIEAIMITGDQSATAYAIGRQLGLSGSRPLQVLESRHLDEMEPALLAGLAKNVHVFARVSPAHKLKIVQALQQAGYVVAMTGDGINDGPALKAADIGVAMGGGGTSVARDVSDVVLEDDNLHTMIIAVSQGRTIYGNIRKMIHFMVSTNLSEIEVMLAGVVLGWGQTLNPMQLLWINLVTDIFPGLALSLEPPEPGVMGRPPRDPAEPIIGRKDLRRMAFESGVISLGALGAYLYGLRRYGVGPAASTLAFHTLTATQLAHALSVRSPYRNVFGGQRLPSNPHLTRAMLGMGGLQVAASLIPAARRLLGTTPLGLADLLVIGAGVLLPLIINEAAKPAPPEQRAGSPPPDCGEAGLPLPDQEQPA